VSIAPPPTGPQPTNYTVTLTPVDGGAPITVICSTPTSCPVAGLSPDTTYLVSCCSHYSLPLVWSSQDAVRARGTWLYLAPPP
jgi:hypothetical protein